MAKILVVKPNPGRFRTLFNKLTNINSKNGPFDLIICVSDLFKEIETPQELEELEELISGKIHIPIRTFCMIGSKKIPKQVQDLAAQNDGSLSSNLELLAPNSIITLSTLDNLKIANFGGSFDPDNYHLDEEQNDSRNPQNIIRSDNLKNFLTKLKSSTTNNSGIDILLTHSLPQLLTLHSKSLPNDPTAPTWGCPPITEILKAAQPRYHFASGGQNRFWEREPWVWDPSSDSNKSSSNHLLMTRFVNLGQFENQSKERWFYAFKISPISQTKPVRPPDATPCPYSSMTRPSQKRNDPMTQDEFSSEPNFRFGEMDPVKKKARSAQPPSNYLCKICQNSGHWIQDCPEKVNKQPKPQDGYICRICNTPGHLIRFCPMAEQHDNVIRNRKNFQPKEIAPDTCWFCLSNPHVAKHLIASIGTETYLSLPKGQLPDTQKRSPVPGGGHVLLIPISHYPSLLALPSELATPIISEIEQYKSALKRCYEAYSASMVSFEVAKLSGRGARAGHAHLQVCPVPNELADRVEQAFQEEGQKQGIDFVDESALKELKEGVKEAVSYFRVCLPNGRELVHLIKPDEKFNLQFGRIALANILGMPDRSNWKACEKSEDEEKQECQNFQKAFSIFEPQGI
ncbi:hypothetical protein O181_007110 [Austropuccinia psidii MF-1]|uniref:CCHC-type domain-containing protein n=1 Tax=Austropuccinia psidii MF-1 TaxID=1389203 RepID=A0A9Q3GHI9_9BASI|nr:hypothetical protein [Austropuccinia psidii MF-1]